MMIKSEEWERKLGRLSLSARYATEKLLNAADDYGYFEAGLNEGGLSTGDVYLDALEDFVRCFEEDSLEESLVRKSYN